MGKQLLMSVIDEAEHTLPSLQPGRAVCIPEKVYLELWRAKNKRGECQTPLIEVILCDPCDGRPMLPREDITRRDCEVATAVVQWLATNCGRAFIWEAERRIEKEDSLRRAVGTDGWATPWTWGIETAEGTEYKAAKQISETFISKEKQPSVCRMLARAILNAIVAFRGEGRQPQLVVSPGQRLYMTEDKRELAGSFGDER